jgi:outer membrane immunogenic protein
MQSLAALALAASPDVGAAVAVTNEVTRESAASKQPLFKGEAVHQDEIIATGIEAEAEVELLDRTRLAVGPEARLILDKFVYDPGLRSSIAFSLSKGAFRFITGIARKDSYEIRTPVAFVGTRGTVFDIFVGSGGATAVLLLEGALEVCNLAGVCRLLNRVGSIVFVGVDGVILLYSSCENSFIRQIGFETAFPFIGKRLVIDPVRRMSPRDFECRPQRTPPVIKALDVTEPPPPSAGVLPWPGLYIGLNGGWAIGPSSLTVISLDPEFHSSGGFGGGQIGYNLEDGRIVYGVEADIQGADISGFTADGDAAYPWIASAHTRLGWFSTIRGRIGYNFGSALLYGTGGFAFGGFEDSVSVTCCYPPAPGYTGAAKNSGTATGYAVGAGIEYAFAPRWSGKLEYLYMDLGSETLAASADAGNAVAIARFDHTYEIIRAGVNYHIFSDYVPLK